MYILNLLPIFVKLEIEIRSSLSKSINQVENKSIKYDTPLRRRLVQWTNHNSVQCLNTTMIIYHFKHILGFIYRVAYLVDFCFYFVLQKSPFCYVACLFFITAIAYCYNWWQRKMAFPACDCSILTNVRNSKYCKLCSLNKTNLQTDKWYLADLYADANWKVAMNSITSYAECMIFQ